MIGGSLLAVLPKGFFNWPNFIDDGAGGSSMTMSMTGEAEGRKRTRASLEGDSYVGGSRTPTLVSSSRRFSCGDVQSVSIESNERPQKRCKGEDDNQSVPQLVDATQECTKDKKQDSPLLTVLPPELISHCLSFLGSAEDRFAIQNTCRLFYELSNSDEMLENVNVSGDMETGKNGIIQEHDTPATAAAALAPFARAGNLEALYMLGVVKCYCYQDLRNGILMLKLASQRGFVRSSYTLGIILRDALPNEARHFMRLAASTGYLPALHEILTSGEMKERFGEPNADELRRHLDPMCLNRLLLRDYVDSAELRGLNTSHCWNPLCGKWAYKATNAGNPFRTRRRMGMHRGETQMETATGPMPVAPSTSPVANASGPAIPFGSPQMVLIRRASVPHSCRTIQALAFQAGEVKVDRVARMKMCSRCCRAKYCSKLCQVYDWRSNQHKIACQFL
eukprot:Nitzschia sp. Nitz4//scaffold20_size174350//156002//157460//NITZ4_002132-RA/size174350-snap-gene-0.227-mRNA-1//1//CDS//3329541899//3603//frame0